MRFPAIVAVYQRALRALRRFPMPVASGAVATIAIFVIIDGTPRPWLVRVFLAGVLGISAFTGWTLVVERYRLSRSVRWLGILVTALALAAFQLVALRWTDEMLPLRFVQLAVVIHLGVASIPFLRAPSQNGFWQMNRLLLERCLLGGVYAGALFVGLAVALAAIDNLLGVNVPNEAYPRLATMFAFGFHPWFVVAGIPDDLDSLEGPIDFPAALKVFAQFVLLPLVAVYLTILTIYLGRVLVTRTWPSGWIGWLVSSVSAVGVVALLLLHPIRDRIENRWVNGYGRWFFGAILPSLGMLLVAIGKRIGQYGVTEPRYFLLILTLWMVGLSLYYVITGSRSVKVIPVSLGLIAGLGSFGPWSAYAVSQRSQLGRMSAILAANGMGTVGAPTRTSTPVSEADREQLGAVLGYLARVHGSRAVARAIGVPADSVATWPQRQPGGERLVEAQAMERLGVEYLASRAPIRAPGPVVSRARDQSVSVAGFDELEAFDVAAGDSASLAIGGITLVADDALQVLAVKRPGRSNLELALGAAIEAQGLDPATHRVFERSLVLDGEGPGIRVRVSIHRLTTSNRAGRMVLTRVAGVLLIRRIS